MHYTSTRGKSGTPHRHPSDPSRRRAKKRQGHGIYTNDRPPIISIISCDTGEPRWWVCDYVDRPTCHGLIADHVPPGSTLLATDAWQRDRGSHPCHATVTHGARAWARDDDGDGQREGYGYTCEGAGAALRTYVRAFRGVHKQYLHLYVATSEAMVHAKQVTSHLIRQMCVSSRSRHTSYT